jgi:YggT family protein
MGPFVISQFVSAVADTLSTLLWLYTWIVIGAVIVSWVSADPRNPIVRFLYATTEPVLYHLRRRLPFVVAGGIDFSPLVLLLLIQFVKVVVVGSLVELATRIRGYA